MKYDIKNYSSPTIITENNLIIPAVANCETLSPYWFGEPTLGRQLSLATTGQLTGSKCLFCNCSGYAGSSVAIYANSAFTVTETGFYSFGMWLKSNDSSKALRLNVYVGGFDYGYYQYYSTQHWMNYSGIYNITNTGICKITIPYWGSNSSKIVWANQPFYFYVDNVYAHKIIDYGGTSTFKHYSFSSRTVT